MNEASLVSRLIAIKKTVQDASGTTIVTWGDHQVHPISSSLSPASLCTGSRFLTMPERSKRVWTLTSLWTHRTRPQVTLKTAKNAVFNSAHTHQLVLKRRKNKKEDKRTDDQTA